MGNNDKSSKKPLKGELISSGPSTGRPDFDYRTSVGLPTGIQSMLESMQRMRDAFDPSSLRMIREMNQQMVNMVAPIKTVTDLVAGMQNTYLPLNSQLQAAMKGVPNNSLLSIAQSMQRMTDQFKSSVAIQNLSGPALLPNIAADFLQNDIWITYPEKDEALDEAAEILEEIKEDGKLSDDAVNRLIELTEESLAEQKKTNQNLSQSAESSKDSLRIQKLQLFLTILMMIISFQSDQKQADDDIEKSMISQETASKLDSLFEKLNKEERQTKANLNLRAEPNSKQETKIYLTIPKGETVAIQYTVSDWSFVYYSEPNTGILRSGWVSKRWLD